MIRHEQTGASRPPIDLREGDDAVLI